MSGFLGDGFTAEDRAMLIRVDERLLGHIASDDERHVKHEELCGKIGTKVSSLQICVTKNKSFISLAKTAVMSIAAIVLAIGGIAYEIVSRR